MKIKGKSNIQKNKLKSTVVSMKTRWMGITVTFLLIIFSVFSFLVYQNSMKLLSQEPIDKIQTATQTVSQLLEQENRPFTKQNILDFLKEEINDQYKTTPKGSNNLLSLLGDHHLNMYIFNPKKQLIFQTRQKEMYVTKPIKQSLHVKKIKDTPGFIYGYPIYSHKTNQCLGYIQVFYTIENISEVKNKLINNICMFLIIAFVLSTLCSAILFNSFLHPIKKLIGTMKKIQDDPIAAERTPLPEKKDELWELTEISNKMIDQIQEYIIHQGQFVQDASHELKTPIAILAGHLNLLNRWGKDDPEVLEESLQLSLQEVNRMQILIDEMLDLTKNTNVELANVKDHCRVVPIMYKLIDNLRLVHTNFQFELIVHLNDQAEIIMTQYHFEQLMTIFLDNAIKYSTDQLKIIVTMEEDMDNLIIHIKDFGEGMTEEDCKKIFRRFYRVDKARSRDKGGNGLGLSIAQKLIDGYKGTVQVHSVLNEGTEFIVSFPKIKNDQRD